MRPPLAAESPPARVDDAQAIKLFLCRARREKGPKWNPSEQELREIAHILQLSGNVPLAIQLAAAWVGRRSFKEIALGLECTPVQQDTWKLLLAGETGRAAPEVVLERCLAWCFGSLELWARDGFVALGVFRGSFTPDSVLAVCQLPNTIAVLVRLQDASLIQFKEVGTTGRYAMPPPVREFAARKLGATYEREAIRQRFGRYYAENAKMKSEVLTRSSDSLEKLNALDWFRHEWPNLPSAIQAEFAALQPLVLADH